MNLHRIYYAILRRIPLGLRSMFLEVLVSTLWVLDKFTHTGIKSDLEYIVSLTSYPPRFGKLHLTIKCLLMQRERSNVILWISHEDIALLPNRVNKLKRFGLIIKACDDTRSYKKLIPALTIFPGKTIITFDDDVYYDRMCVSDLLAGQRRFPGDVVCLRGHKIQAIENSDVPLGPYINWQHEVSGDFSSEFLFPTGVGGILYPPGALSAKVADAAAFMRICPGADDVWFFWMTRLAKRKGAKVGRYRDVFNWRGTQVVSLWNANQLNTGNDEQIKQMLKTFGW